MNIDQAMEEYHSLIKALQNLGLSLYESKAYLALISLGVGSAEVIAENAHIPRTSAYKILESLERKGFVTSTGGRPRVYKPADLRSVRERIIAEVNELFDKLEFIQEFLAEKGEPQLVYTIYGREKVIKKIAEIIDSTEKELIISTPKFSELRKKLMKNIEKAIKRGVRVVIITLPNQKVPQGAMVYRKEGLIATDIVSDNERALLTSPELDACGYTDNPTLSQHLTHFINIMIGK